MRRLLPSPPRRRALVAATFLAVLVIAGSPRQAADAVGSQSSDGVVRRDLPEELRGVPVDSRRYNEARARLERARHDLRVAEEAQERAVAVLDSLTATEGRLAVQLETARTRELAAAQRADELRAGMEALAVSAYVEGGVADLPVGDHLDLELENRTRRDRAVVREVTDHHRDQYVAQVERRDRSGREGDRLEALLGSVRQRHAEAAQARASAEASTVALVDAVRRAEQAVADRRMTARVVGADFPLVALDAFWRAAGKINGLAPSCRLRWAVLAGISRVEGVHGTWGGSSLDGAGDTTERITGPALDGSGGFARIPDSDGGRWDDDTTWDRGVGPMGFIPSSWRMFGADADGDGDADPHNIYDAAEASARLLCWASRDLDTEEGLDAALFRYNRSQRYVRIVSGHIESYDALDLP